MISIEDACQTYGIEPLTIEQWIVQDGVDYRYIWQGKNKIRMVPRSWLIQRTAGEGLRPQLLDSNGMAIGGVFNDLPVSQNAIEPSHGEQRAFEMLQQVVNLQEYQEKRIINSNRWYASLMLVIFAIIAVGIYYNWHNNTTSLALTTKLSEFSQRTLIEQERNQLQEQLLKVQESLNHAIQQEALLNSQLKKERDLNLSLAQKEKSLMDKLSHLKLDIKNKKLQMANQHNLEIDKKLAKQYAKNIELDKQQIELKHQLKTADLHRELAELKNSFEKVKAKLKNRDQQIRNLQLMIGR